MLLIFFTHIIYMLYSYDYSCGYSIHSFCALVTTDLCSYFGLILLFRTYALSIVNGLDIFNSLEISLTKLRQLFQNSDNFFKTQKTVSKRNFLKTQTTFSKLHPLTQWILLNVIVILLRPSRTLNEHYDYTTRSSSHIPMSISSMSILIFMRHFLHTHSKKEILV